MILLENKVRVSKICVCLRRPSGNTAASSEFANRQGKGLDHLFCVAFDVAFGVSPESALPDGLDQRPFQLDTNITMYSYTNNSN